MAYTTIDDPSAHFQAFLYTGNGSNRTITLPGNSDLKFDMYWYKQRSQTGHHRMFDTSRGLSLELYPDLNAADSAATYFNNQQANSFDIIAHDSATNTGDVTFANWQWKANGGTRTTFSESGDNPGGGYQANTTAGFSIVDYTGTQATGTVAHGLGDVPKCIWVKSRGSTRSWTIYHHQMGSPAIEKNMHFNTTAALTDYNAEYWGGTTPTSSVFSLGNGHAVNYNNETFIAYCFAEKQGYSKFGSYKGNGAASGPFAYLGFKPAWVMIKNTGATEAWVMYDTARSPTNAANKKISANDNSGENDNSAVGGVGYNDIDILSNGFKVRTNNAATNQSGKTFIYMAFAENPFVTSKGVPATTR